MYLITVSAEAEGVGWAFCKSRAMYGAKPKLRKVLTSREPRSHRTAVKTCLLAMKITATILLVCSLHVTAKSVSQTITLSGKDIPLKTVFAEIEKQSGYLVAYTQEMISDVKPVTVDAKDEPLLQFLDNTFHAQGLDYIIENKTIIVKTRRVIRGGALNTKKDPPIDVKGRVVDENGEPMEGVTVTVKGTNKVAVTNSKGEFVLQSIDGNSVLMITYVGYNEQEINVRNNTFVSTQLKIAVGTLDELQIIAYGKTSRRFMTGNISTVKGEEIAQQPVQNTLLALEGRVPGLFVTQNTGIPGGGATVRIQGQNSISKGSDPLYVIDGVPYMSQLFDLLGGSIFGNSGPTGYDIPIAGNPLSFLNPLDIESIEVLKDADATAIYGSRAANGAILITTKKGKPGRAKATVNIQQGWQKVANKMEMLNTQQYLEMRKEAFANDGLPIPTYDPNASENYDLAFWDSTDYTDWQKKLIGKTARYSNISSNISGGSSNFQYLFGGTYHYETTVFPGDFYNKKASAHFSLNTVSNNQKFKVQFSGSFMSDKSLLPQVDLTERAVLFEPNAPDIYDVNGNLNWEPSSTGYSTFGANPFGLLRQTAETRSNNLISNAMAQYFITKDLAIRCDLGYANFQSNQFYAVPLVSMRPEDQSGGRMAFYGFRTFNSFNVEPQISYTKAINKEKFDILIGGSVFENKNEGTRINAFGFNSDLVLKDIQSAATITKGGSFNTEYKYNAVFGRVTYAHNEKYIANLNGRRDGSSRFGPQSQFHNFGSVGAAWIFSQEHWIKKNLWWLSFGKLRGSFGTTGSDQIGEYQFLNLYNPTSNIGVPYQGIAAISPFGLNNPYLEWEETKKLFFGLDIGVAKNRVLFNTTFSRNRSSNQLLPYSLPSITGFTTISDNFPATIENTSWEFTLTTINFKSRYISWNSNINLTIPRNKLIDFPDLQTSSYRYSLVIGQPLNVFQAYKFVFVDPISGEYKFQGADGPTSNPDFFTDRNVYVNVSPKYYGGIQNSLSFGAFRLDFMVQFVKQTAASSYLQYAQQFPGIYFNGGGYANQPITVQDRWKKSGETATIQKVSTNWNNTYLIKESTAGFDDASYLRLKNLSLSWNMPKGWCAPIIEDLKFYFQGQNLFTITDYRGLDPENQNISSLPPLRILTFGVQMAF